MVAHTSKLAQRQTRVNPGDFLVSCRPITDIVSKTKWIAPDERHLKLPLVLYMCEHIPYSHPSRHVSAHTNTHTDIRTNTIIWCN